MESFTGQAQGDREPKSIFQKETQYRDRESRSKKLADFEGRFNLQRAKSIHSVQEPSIDQELKCKGFPGLPSRKHDLGGQNMIGTIKIFVERDLITIRKITSFSMSEMGDFGDDPFDPFQPNEMRFFDEMEDRHVPGPQCYDKIAEFYQLACEKSDQFGCPKRLFTKGEVMTLFACLSVAPGRRDSRRSLSDLNAQLKSFLSESEGYRESVLREIANKCGMNHPRNRAPRTARVILPLGTNSRSNNQE
jgi:hypothetical protein